MGGLKHRAFTTNARSTASPYASASSVIYREGAATSGNVFATFPLAYAAAHTAGASTIFVDDSLGAPVVNGHLGFNMLGIELAGFRFDSNQTFLTIGDGVTFTNLNIVRRFLGLIGNSSSPIIIASAGFGEGVPTLRDGSAILGGGTAPFVSVTTGPFFIEMDPEAYLFNAGQAVVSVAAAQTATFLLRERAQIFANAIAGAGTGVADFESTSAAVAAQTVATLTRTLRNVASLLKYTDAAPLMGTTQTQAAIDALKLTAYGNSSGVYSVQATTTQLTGIAKVPAFTTEWSATAAGGAAQSTAFSCPALGTANGSYKSHVSVVAQSATDSASWDFDVLYQVIAGVMTMQGTIPAAGGVAPDNASAGAAAWTATVDFTGTTRRVRVLGDAVITTNFGGIWQDVPRLP